MKVINLAAKREEKRLKEQLKSIDLSREIVQSLIQRAQQQEHLDYTSPLHRPNVQGWNKFILSLDNNY